MKIKEGFVLRDVCGEQVVMAEGLGTLNFGRLLCLNESAAFLWKKAVSKSFSIESLTNDLCEEYDVEKDLAEKDVLSIVGEWQKLNIVE
jgi:hypothetical protein